MSFIVINCDQGSPEWHKARAGVITASNFKIARSFMKVNRDGRKAGDFSGTQENEAFRVAIERISGEPLNEGFETWQMARGHELEPDARLKHQEVIGVKIHRAGFVKTEDGVFGASADGMIDPDGGSEYKCLLSSRGVKDIILDGNLDDFQDQVQGCMWLTGRKWWDFCLYTPFLKSCGRELTRYRVQRDDDYIDSMVTDLMRFRALVDTYERKLRNGLTT